MINTHIRVADLQEKACVVFQADIHPIAIYYAAGKIYAVDNRCPHMGFPLERGSVADGILTCHWHHARFDLATGGAFDQFADDVRAFAVECREGEVWLDLTPPSEEEQRIQVRRRLVHGMERDLNLVIAKAVIALTRREGSDGAAMAQAAADPFATGLDFGAHNRRDGWAMGQTIHVAMMNLLPALDAEDGARALYHGLSAVARDCDGTPARHVIEPLPGRSVGVETLTQWYRRFVEVRDEEGAERCIVTALAAGATPAQMTNLLFSAASDHRFLQIGHTADFANKAIEAWQHVRAAETLDIAPVLASLAPSFAGATRAEESNAWRHPIDLITLLENAYEQFAEVLAAGAKARDGLMAEPAGQVTTLSDTMLGEDPAAITTALLDALRNGMSQEQVAGIVTYAAGVRMARFHTSNEFGDWDTVLHTFTYANALQQAMRRAPSADLLRGVFDAAISVYLDRFLNMPAARIPQPTPSGANPDSLLAEFLPLLNQQQQVNEAALLCARYLAEGGKPERLMATMGKALLREDPDFHTIQTVEAAFTQYRLWRGTPQANHFLIAAVRYLAAHSPTTRAMEQTFRIAWRLHRGDRLFDEE